MGKVTTRKIGLEMNAQLYAKLSKVAERNGQSRRFLLEKALKHYLAVVLPSQGTVRPEVMKHFRRSTEKNRRLHQLLAQSMMAYPYTTVARAIEMHPQLI